MSGEQLAPHRRHECSLPCCPCYAGVQSTVVLPAAGYSGTGHYQLQLDREMQGECTAKCTNTVCMSTVLYIMWMNGVQHLLEGVCTDIIHTYCDNDCLGLYCMCTQCICCLSNAHTLHMYIQSSVLSLSSPVITSF